jgi:Putative beta-barrel porin-2, OmpL-like. bbp2
VDYIYDFRHPKDDTIGGSSEVFRANEVQLTQLGIGGDFHYDNVRARLMTQFGLYSETTPRNDASPARGQWNLADAYRYISEAYGGYHFNVMHGINVDAGIFMSYVGLFSYYQFDNWAYQPSYVSSNTPWFFNGVRVQIFPTEHLKIEPWFVNGWQSYGRFNNRPGIGFQILYRPNGWLSLLGNQYMLGEDALNTPGRVRYHTDDSIEVKYYDQPEHFIDKMAFSLTGDLGCEHGGGVSCDTNSAKGPKQDFLGFMVYHRVWFDHDLFGLTIGGGKINNPGRYLVLLPPINGATAASGTPYFTENPGDPYKAWDMSATFDWMPSQYITWRWEYNYRAANVPYFSGPGGVTPPGGNQGEPGSAVPGWAPDLRRSENRLNMAILVKF